MNLLFSLPLLDSSLITNATGNGVFNTMSVGEQDINNENVLSIEGNTVLGTESTNNTVVNGSLSVTNNLTSTPSNLNLVLMTSTNVLNLPLTSPVYISVAGTTPSATNTVSATPIDVIGSGVLVTSNIILWSIRYTFYVPANVTLNGQYNIVVPVTYTGPALPNNPMFLGQNLLQSITTTSSSIVSFGNVEYYLVNSSGTYNLIGLFNLTNAYSTLTLGISSSINNQFIWVYDVVL